MSKKKRHKAKNGIEVGKLLTVGLVVLFLGYAVVDRLSSPLNEVRIEIKKAADKKSLIKKSEVNALLKDYLGHDISLSNLGQLNLYALENYLEEDSRINKADLFIDKKLRLNIKIDERTPIIRIDVSGGSDYYLDYKGGYIPITDVLRVPVVTGKVDAYKADYTKSKTHNLNSILKLAQEINDNEFMSALVEQIHIDDKNEIIIIPKIGPKRIIIGQVFGKGDPSNLADVLSIEEKMENIEFYYKNGAKKVGLNRFKEIDVRFGSWREDEGQIIGRNTQS